MKIRTIINRAVKHSITKEEYYSHCGSLSKANSKLYKQAEKCTIYVSNLFSFRILLEELATIDRGLNEAIISKFLNHENAHANVAEIVGASHDGYAVVFLKDGIIPFASINHPEEWLDEEDKLLKLIEIFEAPQLYGDKISINDKEKILELQSLLAAHA